MFLKSTARGLFERNVTGVHDPAASAPAFDVPSSMDLQRTTRLARLQITSMNEIDNLDVPGGAELFGRARNGGQRFLSGVVDDRDRFRFAPPHAPFTFLKSIPAGARFSTPVTSIRIRIRTGDVRSAGTDDDVFLRVSDTRRFRLDRRLDDDLQRGDADTYGVPIDGAIADGLSTGDIRYRQIEKSRGGVAGGRRLGGVRVWVNDRLVAAHDRIDRRLEGGHRAWRAPGVARLAPAGPAAPS